MISCNLEPIFCMQDCHSGIAQVEYQSQTLNIRILDSKPSLLHNAKIEDNWKPKLRTAVSWYQPLSTRLIVGLPRFSPTWMRKGFHIMNPQIGKHIHAQRIQIASCQVGRESVFWEWERVKESDCECCCIIAAWMPAVNAATWMCKCCSVRVAAPVLLHESNGLNAAA